jgi:acetyl esterase/lipase
MKATKPAAAKLFLTMGAALLAIACAPAKAAESGNSPQPEVVRLWPGQAPGTESWTGEETQLDVELPGIGKIHVLGNVTVPTVTIFRPPPGKANGAAMLVAPGGAFRALVWDMNGTEVAKWLVDRGITAFVIKYRVRPPQQSAETSGRGAFEIARDIAVADARQALRLVRTNSKTYGVSPDRIGMIGFSAGAVTVMQLALSSDVAARPDFAVTAYGGIPADALPPAAAPPLFIVAAQDDPQVPSRESAEIYRKWTEAKRPAELHLYEKGGHGFAMRTGDRPVDKWPDALEAWLLGQGLIAKTTVYTAKESAP